MATNSKPGTTFARFSDLPGELRNQIWRDALPSEIEPALFLYKLGLWGPFHFGEGEAYHNYENDNMNWYFQWHSNLLDTPHVDIPLLSVNREARSFALESIRKSSNRMGLHFKESGGRSYLTRPWSLYEDILYVPAGQIRQFGNDPHDRMRQPDMQDRYYSGGDAPINIAVPEEVLSMDDFMRGTVDGLMQYYGSIELINIVLGPQPQFQSLSNSTISPGWKLVDAECGAFDYSYRTGEFYPMEGQRRYNSEDALSKRIEKLLELLKEEMRDWDRYSLEVRTVYAVKGPTVR
jgi:hypothetical protein